MLFSIIHSTIKRADSRYENEFLYRSGHSRIIIESLRRRLLREICANPKIHYKEF